MASTSQMQAIIERLKEVTRQKNPGVDIMKKQPKPKAVSKRKKKALH
jgi:hypothetical protein